MESENKVSKKRKSNPNPKSRYTIDWNKVANKNVLAQQSNYMKKHGRSISKGALACKLLETASL